MWHRDVIYSQFDRPLKTPFYRTRKCLKHGPWPSEFRWPCTDYITTADVRNKHYNSRLQYA